MGDAQGTAQGEDHLSQNKPTSVPFQVRPGAAQDVGTNGATASGTRVAGGAAAAAASAPY